MPDLKQRIRIIFREGNLIYKYNGYSTISSHCEDYGI